MKVKCTCGREYEVAPALIGKAVRCQSCSKSFLVPVPKAPPQQATVQMTSAIAPPRTLDQQQQRGPGVSDPLVTQWVPAPVAASETKIRAEREQQIIAQYVAYKPKAGDKLRGADLAKAMLKQRRRTGRKLGFMYLGLGISSTIGAIFGYFKLAAMEEGGADPEQLHWIMTALYTIGGKWAAAIGLGLIGFVLIGVAVMYFSGVFGEREE